MRFASFSVLGPTGKGSFRRPVSSMLLSVGAFLLLSFAGLSSSSEADEPLFTRSAQQLERLWSGVLGCTYPGGGTPRGTFETTFDGSGVPSAVEHDYVECGKRALRNASSRMLVDTVEGALHRGGAALFEDSFRLDSGIEWALGENVTGEFDAVIPLHGGELSDGTEQALFLQPGAVFWPGIEGENRTDANFGLVYRRQFTPDIIVGGSAFYDHDFKRGHRRIGLGADLQSGVLHTALNYYHPLNDWQEGRTDYVEQPLRGADFRLGFAQSRLRVDTSLGIWRFEGEEEESPKWRRAFEVEAGYRIYPGVFLQGGYERHDSGDSLGSRWNAGLAFRFTLPEFEGAASDETMARPDLWEPVEREKRVLYEERPDFAVRLSIEDAVIAEPDPEDCPGGRPEDCPSATTTITGVISGRNLREDEALEVVIHESTTAEHGEGNDFIFSQNIYGADAQTEGQITSTGSAACTSSPCRLEIPASLTARTVEIDVSALADSVEKEIPEFIDLRIDVRDGSSNLVYSSNVARVTIGAHGNTVGFDRNNSDGELMENGGEARVTVEIEEPLLAPVTLQIGTDGTAERGTDYTVPAVLTIPAGAGSASLALTGIDNDKPEGNKTITLELSGSLPEGWNFTDVEHGIVLRDDDLNISFALSNPTLAEESGPDVELMVAANQPLTGAAKIAWSVTEGAGEVAGGSTGGELNFSEGDDETNPQTIAIDLVNDSDPENAERVTVTLNEAGSTLPEGWSLGIASHTLTIEPSDGTITFVSTDPVTAGEGDTVGIDITSTVDAPSRGFPLTVSFAPFASDDIGFPATFLLPAGQRSHRFLITINPDGVPENAETFTMSLGQDEDSEVFPGDWTAVSSTRTINVNPSNRTIGFEGEDASVSEGGGAVEVAVVITPVPVEDVVIPLAIAGDTDAYLPGGSGTVSGSAQTGIAQTYRSGRTEETFRITPLNDVDELDETVTVTLDDSSANFPADYFLGAKSAWEVGIVDDERDRLPTEGDIIGFENSSMEVSEGGNINLFIELTDSGGTPVTSVAEVIPLSLTVRDPGADIDYAGGAGNIPTGSFFANGRVMIAGFSVRDDEVGEIEETVAIDLSEGPGFPGGDWDIDPNASRFTITIPAEDNTVTFGAPSSGSIPEEGGSATIVANIDRPISSGNAAVTVTPRAEDGDAERGKDYRLSVSGGSLSGNTWILPTGTGTATLTITALQDSDKEGGGEPLVLAFTEGALPDGWDSVDATHSVIVTDDDNTIEFASASGTPVREDGATTTTVTLDIEQPIPSSHTGTTTIAIGSVGSAVEGDDYTIGGDDYSGGALTLRAGQQTATFTITAVDDDDYDPGESIILSLSNLDGAPGGWNIGPQGTHAIDITDDNLSGTFGFAATGNNRQTTEGATVRLTVAADQSTDVAVPIEWSVSPAEEVDSPASGRVEIPNGGNEAVITFTIADPAQADPELDKEIIVTITDGNPNTGDGWTLDDSVATHRITVLANDNTVGFADAESNAAEGGADATVNIAVHHPLPSGATASMNVETTNDAGATEDDYIITGTDYSGGVLTIREGQTTATLTVTASDDDDYDLGESVTLSLSGLNLSGVPGGWSLVPGTMHTVIIADDNLSGTFGFAATGNDTEAEEGAIVRLTVTTDKNTDVAVPIEWSVSPAEEVDSPASGRVEIPSGGNEAVITFTVADPAQADPEYEKEIIVTITDGNLNAGDGWTLDNSAATHSVTIPANDNTVEFATPTSATILEEGETSTTVTLNINQPIPSSHTGAVTIGIRRDGSADETADYAIAGDDYSGGVLTLRAGEGTATFTVTAVDDKDYDPDSNTVILQLFDLVGAPEGWEIGANNEFTIDITDSSLTGTFGFASGNITQQIEGGDVTLAIETSQNVDTDVRIGWNISPASAISSSPSSGTVVIPDSGDRATIAFTISDDDIPDDDERIEITLSDANTGDGWTRDSSAATHVVTVPANDNTAGFVDGSNSGNAAESAEGTVRIPISLTNAPPVGGLPVTITITSGNESGVVSLLENEQRETRDIIIPDTATTSYNVTVYINEDDTDFNDNDVVLTLSETAAATFPATWGVLDAATTYTLTVAENDELQTIGFATDASRVNEDESLTIELDTSFIIPEEGFGFELVITGTAERGDATHDGREFFGGDFAVTISPPVANPVTGETPNPGFSINVTDDGNPEGDETFILVIAPESLPIGYVARGIGTQENPHTVTVPAHDNTIGFAKSSIEVTEDADVNPSENVSVNLSIPAPAEMKVRINVTENDDLDAVSGDDITVSVAASDAGKAAFDETTGILTIRQGTDSFDLVVAAVDDDHTDTVARESILVSLEPDFGNPLFRSFSIDLGKSELSVTVVNDDITTIGFTEREIEVAEDDTTWKRYSISASQEIPIDVVLRIHFDEDQHSRLSIARETPSDVRSPLYKELELPLSSVSFVLITREIFFNLIPLDNKDAGGDISIDLILEGSNLPEGWRIGNHERMTVKILEDEGNLVSLAPDNPAEFREGQGSAQICLAASAGGVTTNLDARFIYNGPFGTEETILTTFDANGQNPTTAGGDVDFPDAGSAKDSSVDLTFTAGNLKQCKSFVINSDSDNINEYFTMEIFDLNAVANPGTPSQLLNPADWGNIRLPIRHTFLVQDVDAGGQIGFTAAQSTITEIAGSSNSATITVSVGQRLTNASSVALTLGGSVTARLGTDYVLTGEHYDPEEEILALPANTESVTLTIAAVDDGVLDPAETITFTIAERSGENALPPGWEVGGHTTHTVTITDDESGISFVTHRQEEVISGDGSRITARVGEGERIEIYLSIVPQLEQAQEVYLEFSENNFVNSSGPISMEIDGVPTPFDILNRQVLTLPENRDRVTLTIIANEDANENSETLTLNISEHENALPQGWEIIKPGKYTVNVIDNDAPVGTVYFAKQGDIVDEEEATHAVELVIDGYTLRNAGENLGMTIAGSGEGEIRDITFGGSPLADPLVLPGANAEDNARFTIDIANDMESEGDEQITFTLPSRVTLSSGEKLAVGEGAGRFGTYTLTIRASDNSAGFASPAGTITEDAGTYTLRVQLDDHGAPGGGLPLTLTASGDTGAVLFDSNITVKAGERTADVAVTIYHDEDDQPETVSFTLGEGANFPDEWGGIPDETNSHTLRITDEGIPPSGRSIGFERERATIIEPNDNRNDRSRFPEIAITEHIVKLKISGTIPEGGYALPIIITGSAGASDFTAPSEVMLPAARLESEVSFTVGIREDGDSENDETIILAIGEDLPPGFNIAREYPTHTITIPANDRPIGISSESITILEPLEDFTLDIDGDGYPDAEEPDQQPEQTKVMLRVFTAQSDPAPPGGIPLKLRIIGNFDIGKGHRKASFEGNSQSEDVIAVQIPAGGREVSVSLYIRNDSRRDDVGLGVELEEGDNFPHEWGSISRVNNLAFFIIADRCRCNKPFLIGFTEANSIAFEGDTEVGHFVGVSSNTSFKRDAPIFSEENKVRLGIKIEASSIAVNNDIRINGENLSHSSGPNGDGIIQVTTDIPPGGNLSIQFQIQPDSTPEEDETLSFTIVSTPDNFEVADFNNRHTITIPANDYTVGFSPGAAATLKEDGVPVEIAATANAPAPVPIRLSVATGGTATEGTDYTISGLHLTIPAGQSSGGITLTGMSDDEIEGPKSIDLTIAAISTLPDGWTLGTATHNIILMDDDYRIFFAADAPRSLEEPPGHNNVEHAIEVGIVEAPRTPVTVRVSAGGEGESATSADYAFAATDIIFAANDNSAANLRQTVPVTIRPDDDPESDETIVLMLADDAAGSREAEGSGFSLGGPHTITIPANDNIVGFSLDAAAALGEDGAPVEIAVTTNAPAPELIRLNVATGGAATDGMDYTISGLPLTIPAGQSRGVITLTGRSDGKAEGPESISLTISGNLPDGWTLGAATHNVTLMDDDSGIFFAADALRSLEEPPGPDNVMHMVTVGITVAPSEAITVRVSAGGEGEGATPDDDYTFAATDIIFAANDNSAANLRQTVPVTIRPDDDPEPDETIVLMLADDEAGSREAEGGGFSLGGPHTITISANDNIVGFSPDAAATLEENNVPVEIAVTINVPAPVPITLNVAADGTATEGMDYTILDMSPTIPAGQSNSVITLTGMSDDKIEGPESINLTISGNLPDGWLLGTATHNVTLMDDDSGIFFAAGAPRSIEEPPGPDSVMRMVTVGITAAPSEAITVRVSAGGEDESATPDGDYAFEITDITFAANDNSDDNLRQTFPVTIRPDDDPEPNETIVLTLADDAAGSREAEGGGFLLGGPHTITIPANDNIVGFSPDAAVMLAEDGAPVEIAVTTNAPAPVPIVLNIATGGTATRQLDYTISGTPLRIPAGQSRGVITLTGIDDARAEGPESINLMITANPALPDGWTLGAAMHNVTLHSPGIFFSADAPRSLEESPGFGGVAHRITVGITKAPRTPITVRVSAGGEGESATPGEDYLFATAHITFAANYNSANNLRQAVSIRIYDDHFREPDETIVLTLADVTAGSQGAEGGGFLLGGPHTITIPANDYIIGFSPIAATLEEEDGRVSVAVIANAPVPVPITLNVATSGTATRGTDYTISDLPLTIPAGQVSDFITLTGINDDEIEGPESIDLKITANSTLPDGWTVSTATHNVILTDDDYRISFEVDAPRSIEEPPGPGSVTHMIKVGIARAPSAPVTVRVSAGGEGESATSSDYAFAATSITFAANDNSDANLKQTVLLAIRSDDDPEPDETIVLTLADDAAGSRTAEGSGFLLGGSHTVTIPANDYTVEFSPGAAETLEENDVPVEIAVTTNVPAPEFIRLNVASGGTATRGTDYTMSGVPLTILAGQSSDVITLTGIDDGEIDGPESIDLTITADTTLPDGWMIGTGTHNITLIDNDYRIFFAADAPRSLKEPPGPGNVTHMITVGIARAPSAAITVRVSAGGEGESATSSDYGFTTTDIIFAANDNSSANLRQTVPVTIRPDDDPEPDETIVLTLADDAAGSREAEGSGFSLGGPHTITIPANDYTVGFSPGAAATLEENDVPVEIAVTTKVPAPVPVTLNVATGGTATEGTDYTISGPYLGIPAGQPSGVITLTGMSDSKAEGTESINLTITVTSTLPDGWTLGAAMHNITLMDDNSGIFFAADSPRSLEEPSGPDNAMHMITVGVTRAPGAPVTVRVSSGGEGESATSGDYVFEATDVTFAANDNSDANLRQTVPVTIRPDDNPEPDEIIVLTLADDAAGSRVAEGGGFLLGGPHTITILANDNIVGFSPDAAATLQEGGGPVEIAVTTNAPAPVPITLNVTAGGTATEGADYTISRPSLRIPKRQSRGVITLTGIDDGKAEGPEFIDLTITADSTLPDGWTFGAATHSMTLIESPSIFFTADAPRSLEEPLGPDNVVHAIKVGITAAPREDITVRVLAGGEGERATSGDYDFTTTDIIFMANDNSSANLRQTVSVIIRPDDDPEPDETIVLTLADDEAGSREAEGGGFLLGGPHTITILANGNDHTVGFSPGAVATIEEGLAPVEIPVVANAPAPVPITLNIASGGTATEGTDYTISGLPLTIPAGQSRGVITLTGINDGKVEEPESIEFTITAISNPPDGWGLGATTHNITLVDGHSIFFAADAPRSIEEPPGPDGVTHRITVGIARAPSAPITVRVLAGGEGQSATPDQDYTFAATDITFAANDNSATNLRQTVSITIRPDRFPEPNETIVLTLADDEAGSREAEGGGFLLDGPHTITIPENGNIVGFSHRGATTLEEGGVPVEISVVTNAPAPVPIVLNVAIGGTATRGADYTISGLPMRIPAGRSRGAITLTGIDDGKAEDPESIRVTILANSTLPDGWTLGEAVRGVTLIQP